LEEFFALVLFGSTTPPPPPFVSVIAAGGGRKGEVGAREDDSYKKHVLLPYVFPPWFYNTQELWRGVSLLFLRL
jgi:hypothetical protein